ncbi:MAG: hypothetical protein ACTSU9_01825 [Promethearchaeota archaeon]
MDYEETTEQLITKTMEDFSMRKEYQLFLDFLPHTMDIDIDKERTLDDSTETEVRKLIDSSS